MAIIQKGKDAVRPGDTFLAPVQRALSPEEVQLRKLLRLEGLELLPEGTAVQLMRPLQGQSFIVPDIIVAGSKVAVQYDPAFTHDAPESQKRDQEQNKRLQEVGWRVVRLRTGGLHPISPGDNVLAAYLNRQAARRVALLCQEKESYSSSS